MNSKGIVIFKGIEKRDGGKFKDATGREIDYDSSYVIKFDENTNGSINERKLKFPYSNTYLANKFQALDAYTQVEIECDVVFHTNGVRLVPINVETDFETKETN